MKRLLILLLLCVGTNGALAQDSYLSTSHAGRGSNSAVVVDLPPEVFTQGQNNTQPCTRCCFYENRSYTEGAVLKTDGVLLQCARDEKSLGTNNLIWRIIK